MRRTRTPITLALAGLLASLIMFVSPGTAVAVESTELRWSAVNTGQYSQFTYADPKGGVTLGCNTSSSDSNGNVRSYNTSGQLVRNLPEDVCILRPAVDKSGDIYGYSSSQGDLLAYSGNTLKWRYATECSPTPTVGADGNIYAAAETGRLIALSPNVKSGQALPEKVRDVPLDIPLGCGAEFNAFKYGLWTSSGATTFFFYSYGGKKLAEFTTARRPVPVSVNANGLLIYGNQSIVTAFDPMTNSQKWSINLSTLGRTISVAKLYATSDGGVVVQTSGTAPELIKLNASGNHVREIWSKTFPSVDNDGNEFGEIQGVANGHGKLALFRSANLKTSDSATKVPAIGIAVLNVANGDLVFNKTLHGNLDATHGSLYGYQMDGDTSRGLAIGVDTVYVRAKCAGVCADTSAKLFPIKVPGMRLDYPRGTVLTINQPQQPAAGAYVAMGDSFSSGESVLEFEESSRTATNKCHRSEEAYSKVLSRDVTLAPFLGSDKFVACSGATTKHITGQWSPADSDPDKNLDEAPQLAALSGNTQYVTITIGGNDIGFPQFGEECFWRLCDSSTSIYTQTVGKIDNELPAKLDTAYRAILTKAPNAKIYVLGYPQVVADKATTDPYDQRCFYMYDGENTANEWADAQAAREIVTKLNQKISAKVTGIRGLNSDYYQRLSYVPLDGATSPFNGHETCGTGTSWFQNVDQAVIDKNYIFHPNKLGQAEGYAAAMKATLNAG